mgnify:CR=1 FL=1
MAASRMAAGMRSSGVKMRYFSSRVSVTRRTRPDRSVTTREKSAPPHKSGLGASPTAPASPRNASNTNNAKKKRHRLRTGAPPPSRLLIKSAARKLRVGRGFAAPLNERFSCLSVKPLGGLDGANSAERGLSSFWQGRRCLPCLYISIISFSLAEALASALAT